MPELLPFRALRYDRSVVPDHATVLCPPYDIIAPAEREVLAARDPHNAVHVELPVARAAGDRYSHAADLFAAWQREGALRLDDRPMIYLYEQRYRLSGPGRQANERSACGFFCRLRLERPGSGVRRHERTMSAPKEDRFRLLAAVRANLSPVLMLYRAGRGGKESRELIDRLSSAAPAVEATTDDAVRHRLWSFDPTESVAAAELLAVGARDALTIADGHHRYETALRYRDEVGGPGADYVLCLLHDADSGGLGLLPTHRLLHGVPEAEALLTGMAELFDLEQQPDAVALEQALAAASGGVIGAWTRHGGALLRPRREVLAPLLPAASERLRWLDVSVLATALERVVGIPAAVLDERGKLSYTKDASEAVASVDSAAADACFLLNPTPIDAVLEVSEAGELMPPKSTYFVPKAATGLVFNLLSA